MRRRTSLSSALILGLVAVLSTAPALLAQQDQEAQEQEVKEDYSQPFYEGLEVTPRAGLGNEGEQLQASDVSFDPGAYIPERTYPESMVVKVQAGTFAFRVQSDALVDPQNDSIPILTANPPIDLGANPNEIFLDDDLSNDERTFTEIGDVENCSGNPPHTLCLLSPSVLGQNFVRLVAGDTIFLPDNSTCFFCNSTATGEEAELLVWAPATGFSWHQLYESERAAASGTPEAQQQGVQVIQGWMFNPGSRCT